MLMTPSPNDCIETEQERVDRWVVKQLSSLGLTTNQIGRVVVAKADYHELAKLINEGCPTDVAVDILT